jgi:hypothetical protein
MSTSHRVAAVATAALALAATVGPATPSAHAAPPYLSMASHITITPVEGPLTEGGYPARQVIAIDGTVTLSQTAAQDAINHGYKIYLRYWGDDTNSDDLLTGPRYPKIVEAVADGLHFHDQVTFNHQLLDEDNGRLENIGDGGMDEIYVGARFIDPNGREVSKVESNRIEGDL